MDYKDELIQIGLKMKEKSNFFHKKLRSAPEGRIQIVNSKDGIRISQMINKNYTTKRIGIKRRNDLVRSMVRKAYMQEQVKRLDKNIVILRNAVKQMDDMNYESVVKCMPANYHLLDDKYKTDWVASDMHPVFTDTVAIANFMLCVPEELIDKWGSTPYKANTVLLQGIKHRTETGIYMRSKSEISIFDIYKRLGIPVHYDEILSFNGVIKSPDFISMRFDGKLIYHEHCGCVYDSEYMAAHNKKMELYQRVGIVPWENLIVTYENTDGGIDLQLVEAEIKSKLKI